jgi:septal ring factor EnvC (AmiA/AmiB activator)
LRQGHFSSIEYGMSENDRVQFKFMIPAYLKLALEDAAHDNRRSLSAEIIARLEESIHPSEALQSEVDKMYKTIETIIERTIRQVRNEERKSGLPPLEIDRDHPMDDPDD